MLCRSQGPVHKIKDRSDHDWGTKEPVNKKKVDKVEIYVILIEKPNISDRGTIIDFKVWARLASKILAKSFAY